ncbi:MAG: DUF222 domain-containing protein [Pseudomonadota bacterium]
MPCTHSDLQVALAGQPTSQLARIQQLDQEIGQLAAHLNAANCRLLELIAEFDELGGWGDQGALSCAHWLNWKCGISLNAAREKLRTGKALAKLPKIRECFAAGRISYSKVRAMTRVATPENEDSLLNVALHGTASHIEKLVRGYRWRIRVDEENADERKQQDNRLCHALWQEDGSLNITARVSPEHGALILKALQAAVESLDEDVSAVTSEDPVKGGDGIPQRRADALVLMAETFLAGGAQSVSGGDKNQVVIIADAGVMANESEAGKCCVEHGPNIAAATLRRIGCDASRRFVAIDKAGEPVNIGRKSRTIPPPMRRALLLRDGGCRFPGCTHTHFVDGHHIIHWADGGETSLENLVTLCRRHHRLVHEGGFDVSRIGPNQFQFTSPRGNVVAEAAPPPDGIPNLHDAIQTLNDELDLTINDRTLGLWDGGTLNYSESVEHLQILDGRFTH